VGQNSQKSLKICYLNFSPCQISSRSVKPPWRKALQFFLHPSIFWLPGEPPGPKVTGLGGRVHQPPSDYLQNFVPFRRPRSDISAAKLIYLARSAKVAERAICFTDRNFFLFLFIFINDFSETNYLKIRLDRFSQSLHRMKAFWP